VADEKPDRSGTLKFDQSYVVNPNNLIATAAITVNKKQNTLGLIAAEKGCNRVYFANVSVGTSITASGDNYSRNSRKYLIKSLTNSIDLAEILVRAGAIVTDKKTGTEDFDLSPELLNKSTIIDLFR